MIERVLSPLKRLRLPIGQLGWAATFLIGLSILLFLVRTTVSGWEEIQRYDWRFNYSLLALSLLMLTGNTLQQSAILRFVLKRLNNDLSFRQVFSMLSIANLGSYLPGRFWAYAGLAYMGRRHQVSALASGVGIVTTVATSSIAGAILSLLVGYRYLDRRMVIVALLVVPLLLLMVHPAVVNWTLGRIPKRWRGAQMLIPLSLAEILGLVAWQLFSWTVQGLHLSTLVLSIWPLSLKNAASIVGIAPAAWLAGYYSFLTPGGLGIREGVMAFLLSAYMPASFAAGVALLAQIAITIVQVVCALIGLRILRSTGVAEAQVEVPS